MEIMMEYLGKGFINMLMIAMPCVLTAAGIGLVVGILQAVTQVQEQTIAAAPKILGVFLVIMIMGGFFVNVLKGYFYEGMNLAFNIIPHQQNFVLPPEGYTGKKGFFDQKHYSTINKPEIEEIMKNPGKVPYAQQKEKSKILSGAKNAASNPNLLEKRRINGQY